MTFYILKLFCVIYIREAFDLIVFESSYRLYKQLTMNKYRWYNGRYYSNTVNYVYL